MKARVFGLRRCRIDGERKLPRALHPQAATVTKHAAQDDSSAQQSKIGIGEPIGRRWISHHIRDDVVSIILKIFSAVR
jgi:hypothetical protein